MGIVSKVMKAGLLAKAVEEARKPENQRKIKELIAKVQAEAKARKAR